MIKTALISFLLMKVVYGHITYICISHYNGIMNVYGSNYHSGNTNGGIIVAGYQFGQTCSVPYGKLPSTGNFGDVPCYTTQSGKNEWSCGVMRNWENTSPLTFANVMAESPYINCKPIGKANEKYKIDSTGMTWNKVSFPVSTCGRGIYYSFSTTANGCEDAPFSNVWATIECRAPDITPQFIPNTDCPLNPTIIYKFDFSK